MIIAWALASLHGQSSRLTLHPIILVSVLRACSFAPDGPKHGTPGGEAFLYCALLMHNSRYRSNPRVIGLGPNSLQGLSACIKVEHLPCVATAQHHHDLIQTSSRPMNLNQGFILYHSFELRSNTLSILQLPDSIRFRPSHLTSASNCIRKFSRLHLHPLLSYRAQTAAVKALPHNAYQRTAPRCLSRPFYPSTVTKQLLHR